jgi:hypothetical protein
VTRHWLIPESGSHLCRSLLLGRPMPGLHVPDQVIAK